MKTVAEVIRVSRSNLVERLQHGLLLDRHAGGAERRHVGRIAVDERN